MLRERGNIFLLNSIDAADKRHGPSHDALQHPRGAEVLSDVGRVQGLQQVCRVLGNNQRAKGRHLHRRSAQGVDSSKGWLRYRDVELHHQRSRQAVLQHCRN